jgi:Holliday junction resolvase-like predicted endonuclease
MEQLQLFKNSSLNNLSAFFDNNIDSIRQGSKGEQLCRNFLKNNNLDFNQLDFIFEKNNKLYSVEVKTSEKYNNPDAHGLSKFQYDKRIKLYEKHNIEPYLFVYCQTDFVIYWESMLRLKENGSFLSSTKKNILFNIDGFQKYKIENYI